WISIGRRTQSFAQSTCGISTSPARCSDGFCIAIPTRTDISRPRFATILALRASRACSRRRVSSASNTSRCSAGSWRFTSRENGTRMAAEIDVSKWSGEGTFTQPLVDQLKTIDGVSLVRVEDAPASRSEADYNFMSNEIFLVFETGVRRESTRRLGLFPG